MPSRLDVLGRHWAPVAALTAAVLAVACGPAPPPAVKLSVRFVDPVWTGGSIPAGQQCAAEGGSGALPALRVAGLTETTRTIQVAINNADDPSLSTDGGHGVIGFEHTIGGAVAITPPVPGGTSAMPDGAFLIAANRAVLDPAVPGFLPPCSGRAGHVYLAEVTALDAEGQATGLGSIRLGRY